MASLNTLHIVNKSPTGSLALSHCVKAAEATDGILLVEDGVYCLANGLLEEAATQRVYAIDEDLSARGIKTAGTSTQQVTYEEFVKLCAQYKRTVSWV